MSILRLKSAKANPLTKLQKIAMDGHSTSSEKPQPLLRCLLSMAISFISLWRACNLTFIFFVGLLCAEGALSFIRGIHAYFNSLSTLPVDASKEEYGVQPSNSASNVTPEPCASGEKIPLQIPQSQSITQFGLPFDKPVSPPGAPKIQLDRSLDECRVFLKESRTRELNDLEIVSLVLNEALPIHSLENVLDDPFRAVQVRRAAISLGCTPSTKTALALHVNRLPHHKYDFAKVMGRCAENVIGYIPIPVGVTGPLVVDGLKYLIPMATTEGALIASTSRGIKALNAGSGVSTVLTDDGMTRAPVLRFPSITLAAAAKRFIDSEEGFRLLEENFAKTTNYGHLISVVTRLVGSELYLRFKAYTGDAMGMNMVGKGVTQAILALQECTLCPALAHMTLVSLSGNFCADKKAAAVNWIEGRGKSVSAEAVIPAKTVKQVLKCDVKNLVKLNISKNLVGSALAGCAVGGFNAQAANIVAAIFIATGQDPAQVVTSANCITLMEETLEGDLKASVTMPSIEVGIIGGGTVLEAQSAMLDLMGAREKSPEHDGCGSGSLARVISSAVLAGELSLCSALVTRDLIKSHMALNRKNPTD